MIREGGNRFSETIMPNQEYDPAPPFDSGHPDRAPESIKAALTERYGKARAALRDSITQPVVA
jgi:cyclohexyl-isocyanide hydratase